MGRIFAGVARTGRRAESREIRRPQNRYVRIAETRHEKQTVHGQRQADADARPGRRMRLSADRLSANGQSGMDAGAVDL